MQKTIDPEFHEMIPPLASNEYELLKEAFNRKVVVMLLLYGMVL